MEAFLGLLLGIFSGMMTGSFSLPMKKTTKWSWEATWFIWSIVALIIIPWAIAISTVPNAFSMFSEASIKDMILVFAFGLCWGLGTVLFGQSLAMIGISLAFALCYGLATAFGALIPMLKEPAVFTTPAGILSTLGTLIIVLGVAVCSIAGHKKEKQLKAADPNGKSTEENTEKRSTGTMLIGLILGATGGILGSALNLAFNFSESIKESALSAGASISSASDAVWVLALLGGFVTNLIYCSFRLTRNRTWSDYVKPEAKSHWLLAALMGVIWMPSIALYGRAAVMMGDLGGSAGWGLYMGTVIVMSTLWGFITGEWRKVHGGPVRLMIVGIILLLIAISLIGYATCLTH